jgi:hypothetical protein
VHGIEPAIQLPCRGVLTNRLTVEVPPDLSISGAKLAKRLRGSTQEVANPPGLQTQDLARCGDQKFPIHAERERKPSVDL